MKAFILAAGKGKRLLPLTKEIPKPLISVNGITLIERNIIKLKNAGVKDLVINVSYLSEKIIAHLGDGSDLGVQINYSIEQELLGTGGAITNAIDLLDSDPFLLVSSDVYTDINFSEISLPKNKSAHLICSKKKDIEADFFLDGDKINLDNRGEGLVYSGIGIFDPKLFQGLEKKKYPLWTEIIEPAVKRKEVTGYFYRGLIANLNSLNEIEKLDALLS